MKTLFFILVVLSCFKAVAGPSINQRIVMVHSYPEGEWYYGISNSFQSAVKPSGFQITNLLFDYEQLKFKSKIFQELRAKELVSTILKINPKYVIINDDEAVNSVAKWIPRGTRVILNGINQAPENSSWSKDFDWSQYCGVVEHYPIENSMNMISKMSKKINSMAILSSNGESSKIVASIFSRLTPQQLHNVKLGKIYLHSRWEQWKVAIEEINRTVDLAWILVPYEVIKEDGQAISLEEMSNYIRTHVKVPLLGILSIHTKMGFLSAISVDPSGLGKQAAQIIQKLENGKKCRDIGFEKSKYHNFEINVEEAKRLKLKIPDEFIGVAKFIETSQLKYGR